MIKKILIIEDDIILLNLLRDKFFKKGYSVIVEKNGQLGLATAERERPDLILLDMVLPEMDGITVLEHLKNGSASEIPVIVISNSGQPVEISRIKKLGVRDYLIKTEFDPEELIRVVNKFFGYKNNSIPKNFAGKLNFKEEQDASANRNGAIQNKGENKTKIMIIEDDKFLRELLIKKFENENTDINGFVSAEEAFNFLENNTPHIILLDLILPGMNGFEFLKKIKSNKKTSAIPVIILSNLSEEKDKELAANLGAEDFLVKAFHSPNEIIEKTKEILAKDYI